MTTSPDDLTRTFKEVFSQLASGVCVVTFWRGGRLHGFTATSVISVSLNPLRVLFCVSQASESYSCLNSGSVIGISILDAEQRTLSDRFARKVAFVLFVTVARQPGHRRQLFCGSHDPLPCRPHHGERKDGQIQ